ncbi:MAG: DUF4105 domain-containing protein [Gemmatimonadota bacterium]
MPAVEIVGREVTIHGIRRFGYTEAGSPIPRYADYRVDLDQLETVWFILVPLSEKWRGPAHSFVSFGFRDSTFLAISIEARREIGESFGVLKGLFRQFELIYVVGEESDLIGKRAMFEARDLYLFPMRAPPEKARKLFVAMLRRADRLRLEPEFYNTITNNCTSNLVRAVNQISPGRIPAGIATVLPGYADEVALRLGLIDADLDLTTAKQRFEIGKRARAAFGRPDFSTAIRRPE